MFALEIKTSILILLWILRIDFRHYKLLELFLRISLHIIIQSDLLILILHEIVDLDIWRNDNLLSAYVCACLLTNLLFGATTINMMTFSRVTRSIIYSLYCDTQKNILMSVAFFDMFLNIVVLSVVMLSVVLLSVVMLWVN